MIITIIAGLGILSLAHSSGQMSDFERIAQVAHIIRATVSVSQRLLMTNERPLGILSGRSW